MAKAKSKPEPPAEVPGVHVMKIEDVAFDVANARKRTDRNRKAIRDSLAQLGPGRSIVIDGNNVVRAGNGTLEAATADKSITEILVVEPKRNQLVAVKRSDWTNVEATRYGIQDNRSSELAEWEEQALAETLESLRSEDVDLDDVGFSQDEFEELLSKLADDVIGDDVEKDVRTQIDHVIFINEKRIPMTPEESAEIEAALEDHANAAGSYFGFVSSLMMAVRLSKHG